MIYLDNAATTFPKPPEVYDRTFEFIRESGGNPGRGGHSLSFAASGMVEETRRLLARFFGVGDPRRVVFTAGCTDSINIVLHGLLQSGDHVVASSLDHNAVSRPLQLLQARGVEVTRVPFQGAGRLEPSAAEDCIRHNTKLIVLTHGSNVLGAVQPPGPFLELARRKGIAVLLDAAQTAGRVEVREDGAPVFIACSGHKGLFGLPGLGVLTVPPGFELRKWRVGGTGTASESLDHPEDMPMRLEAGTQNVPGIASLRFGVEYILREGQERIHAREHALALRLLAYLKGDGRFRVYADPVETGALPVIPFNLAGAGPVEVAEVLDQSFGIAVRAGLHCAAVVHRQLGTEPGGCLRVSPGYFNTEADIDTLTDALSKIADGYGSGFLA